MNCNNWDEYERHVQPVNKELALLTYLAINAAVTRRLLVNTTERSIS